MLAVELLEEELEMVVVGFCRISLVWMVRLVRLALIDLMEEQEGVVTGRDEADHCSGYFLVRKVLKNYHSGPSRFLHWSV